MVSLFERLAEKLVRNGFDVDGKKKQTSQATAGVRVSSMGGKKKGGCC